MSKVDTLMTLASALEKRNYAQAAACLSDRFIYYGTGTQRLTGPQFLELLQTMQSAIPTLHFHLQALREEGSVVRAHLQLSGLLSHSPALVEAASTEEQTLNLVEESLECLFEGDTIVGIRLRALEKSDGVKQLLQELGASLRQS
jgi:predicted ester cyclase